MLTHSIGPWVYVCLCLREPLESFFFKSKQNDERKKHTNRIKRLFHTNHVNLNKWAEWKAAFKHTNKVSQKQRPKWVKQKGQITTNPIENWAVYIRCALKKKRLNNCPKISRKIHTNTWGFVEKKMLNKNTHVCIDITLSTSSSTCM